MLPETLNKKLTWTSGQKKGRKQLQATEEKCIPDSAFIKATLDNTSWSKNLINFPKL